MNKITGFSYLDIPVKILTTFLVGFFLFVLITISYNTYIVINPGNVILEETIPRSGGTYTVNNRYSDVHNMDILVPFNAYTRDIILQVKEWDIDDYDLPEKVRPISSMIEIQTDFEGYTRVPLQITIPIEIDATNEFAMGFTYHADGTLEAIPVIELNDHYITIKNQQFSTFFISVIDRSTLINLATNGNTLSTGYVPGVDDWAFPNYGSTLAINGHCAGQSLTSMYYYITQTKNGGPTLQEFSNNNTPTVWFDDRNGYRFASVIQDKVSFTSEAFLPFTDNSYEADYLSYHSFLYAMYITEVPQFMAIYAHQGNTVYSGHAMLVYKAEGGNLYVADPNFPSLQNRFIPFSTTTGYATYSSGDNANAIAQLGTIQYDTFAFLGLWSFVDQSILDNEYPKFVDGTIAQFSMPTINPSYITTDISGPIYETITNTIQIPFNYNDLVSETYDDHLALRIDIASSTIIYTIFIDGEVYIDNLTNPSLLPLEFQIPFDDIDGTIGIFAEEVIGGRALYADYFEFTVQFQQ